MTIFEICWLLIYLDVIPEEIITPSKENSRADNTNNQDSISISRNDIVSKNSNNSLSNSSMSK